MRLRLAGALLALPLLLALALTGCGGSDEGDGIATVRGDATEEPDSEDNPEELTEDEMFEAQLEYAQCLREHGLDVADPEPGGPLQIELAGDPAEAEAAQVACQDLLPQGGPAGGQPDPEVQELMLAFAECMRANGVEGFPDPQPGGEAGAGPEQADDPDFEAAQEKCNEEVTGSQRGVDSSGGDT